MDILIVGAGPTGLTAAVELARRGIVPRVIDKRPGPSELSRAVGILQRSMDILAPSGVADKIRAEAVRFDGIAFHKGARRIAKFPLNFDDRTRLFGLPQDRTEHLLARAFERYGGKIEFGTSFEGLSQDEAGLRVQLGGTVQSFDHLIGADGAHSDVRAALGLDFPGFDLPGQWSIADVDSPDWRDPKTFQGFLLPRGEVCIVAPLEATRFRVIASQPDALAALPVPMNVTQVRRSGVFTISVRQVTDYAVGRVYLAGDAAHCHSPAGGRGMNLGIADAADLAGRLIDGGLGGYHAARHAEGAHVLAFSEGLRKTVQATSPLRRAVMPRVMKMVAAIPPFQRAAMRYFVNG